MNHVLVTGANSGIGLAIVKLFLENNYIVFAHYRKSNNNLIKLNNKNLYLFKADFSNSEEVIKLCNEVFKISNKIDILINNAGFYNRVDKFDELNLSDFDKTININLKAPFILSQNYIKAMKKYNTGHIVNISSIGVKYGGSPLSIFYTISKSALETMGLSLSKESAKYNILVNSIRVGVTDTKIHKNKDLNKRIEMIPLKRMAQPEEIAEYIYCIIQNKFITGSIETIAGGE